MDDDDFVQMKIWA